MIEKPWDHLKKLRLEKGLTQTELAKGIVSQSMICHLEAGRAVPSNETLTLIAERLGADAKEWIESWCIYKTRQMVRDLLWEAFLIEDADKIYDLIGLYVEILADFEIMIYLGWLAAHETSIRQAELSIEAAWAYGMRNRTITHSEHQKILVVEAKVHEKIYSKTNRYYAAEWWSRVGASRLSILSQNRVLDSIN